MADEVTHHVLGPELAEGQRPQLAVPAGTWQGARSLGEWTLFGTFMAPPYTDDAVEFADPDWLAARIPEHAAEIRRLCTQV